MPEFIRDHNHIVFLFRFINLAHFFSGILQNILAKVTVVHTYFYEGQSNWFTFLVFFVRMRFERTLCRLSYMILLLKY